MVARPPTPYGAPSIIACGRQWPALLAVCPSGHNRLVAFRLLKTSETDRTPFYARPFKCRACGSREVTLFAIESDAGLANVQRAKAGPPQPATAPTTPDPRPDPYKDLI